MLQRDEMLASVPDAQTIDCVAADGGDEAQPSAGDVVWSDQRRRGFLRVKGLARSEPGRMQYRIWILDGSRGKPVSGGVFQVAEQAGEVVVPILPQAPVQGPTMFVVTAEEPGSDGEYNADRARVVARAD
jgi:anti-sigma-K factor RskA